MTTFTNAQTRVATASKVKGPIRCHKCQLKCIDAEHYLSHKCEPSHASIAELYKR